MADLSKIFPPLEIQTEKLGALRIDELNGQALMSYERIHKSKKGTSDQDIARALMLTMAKKCSAEGEGEGTALSEAEGEQITENDVHTFALEVLKREGGGQQQELPKDASPETCLVHYLKGLYEKTTESARNWEAALGSGWLSKTSQDLFGKQRLQSEKMNSLLHGLDFSHLGIANDFAKKIQWLDKLPRNIVPYSLSGLTLFQRDNAPESATERLASEMDKLAGINPTEIPRFSLGAKDLQETIRRTSAPNKLVVKMDELIAITALMSASIETTNKLVNQVLLDNAKSIKSLIETAEKSTKTVINEAKDQAKNDAETQKKSLRLAVIGIFASVILGAVSIVIALFCYSNDKESINMQRADQLQSFESEKSKFSILQRQLDAQEMQTEILRELSALSTLKAKKTSLKKN